MNLRFKSDLNLLVLLCEKIRSQYEKDIVKKMYNTHISKFSSLQKVFLHFFIFITHCRDTAFTIKIHLFSKNKKRYSTQIHSETVQMTVFLERHVRLADRYKVDRELHSISNEQILSMKTK